MGKIQHHGFGRVVAKHTGSAMIQAYTFETTVLKDGIIRLPEIAGFTDYPAEVLVVIREPDRKPPERQPIVARVQAVDGFLDKWTGFLKGGEPDESKWQYLTEKYQ